MPEVARRYRITSERAIVGFHAATVKDTVGSSGVDTTANTAWAVVDQNGEYSVATTVFTEKVFTITVS